MCSVIINDEISESYDFFSVFSRNIESELYTDFVENIYHINLIGLQIRREYHIAVNHRVISPKYRVYDSDKFVADGLDSAGNSCQTNFCGDFDRLVLLG